MTKPVLIQPNILVIERRLVTPPKGDPNLDRDSEIQFGAFGLFEDVNDYILPPGDYATLEATGFDKHGFPKGYQLRSRRPRLTVEQEQPSRKIEVLK